MNESEWDENIRRGRRRRNHRLPRPGGDLVYIPSRRQPGIARIVAPSKIM